jgi:hypothetical protein
MSDRKTKPQSERIMAGVYLGIMIAGVNALIVLGTAVASVAIWKAAAQCGHSAAHGRRDFAPLGNSISCGYGRS